MAPNLTYTINEIQERQVYTTCLNDKTKVVCNRENQTSARGALNEEVL